MARDDLPASSTVAAMRGKVGSENCEVVSNLCQACLPCPYTQSALDSPVTLTFDLLTGF